MDRISRISLAFSTALSVWFLHLAGWAQAGELSLLSWCWSVGVSNGGEADRGPGRGKWVWKKTAVKHTHWSKAWISSLHLLSSSHPPAPPLWDSWHLDNTVTAWGCAQFVIYCGPRCACVCVVDGQLISGHKTNELQSLTSRPPNKRPNKSMKKSLSKAVNNQ